MTLHVRFEYPICVPSFVPIHWLVFAVRLLTLKNKKKKKKMMKKRPAPPYVLSTTVLSHRDSVKHDIRFLMWSDFLAVGLQCITNITNGKCNPIWAMMIVWRTRGDYRTARAVLEAIIAFSAKHTLWATPTGQTDLPLSRWVHFTVLRCICVFVFSCISLHACCIIVTRWGGPGGIEAWSDYWPSSFSALTLLVGSHDL